MTNTSPITNPPPCFEPDCDSCPYRAVCKARKTAPLGSWTFSPIVTHIVTGDYVGDPISPGDLITLCKTGRLDE